MKPTNQQIVEAQRIACINSKNYTMFYVRHLITSDELSDLLEERDVLRDQNIKMKLANILEGKSLQDPHDRFEVIERDKLAALINERDELRIQRDNYRTFAEAVTMSNHPLRQVGKI